MLEIPCVERIAKEAVGRGSRECATAGLMTLTGGIAPILIEHPDYLVDSVSASDQEPPGPLDQLEALAVGLDGMFVEVVEIAFWGTMRRPALGELGLGAPFDVLLEVDDVLVGGTRLDGEDEDVIGGKILLLRGLNDTESAILEKPGEPARINGISSESVNGPGENGIGASCFDSLEEALEARSLPRVFCGLTLLDFIDDL